MLGMMDSFQPLFEAREATVHCPHVVQTLTEPELIEPVPLFDGWFIGDDPATAAVFEAGKAGRLKAAVQWGIGVDNADFAAAKRGGIPVANTPNMFGNEVADIAMCYVPGLARETFLVDREVRKGNWPKPRAISLRGKRAGVIGYGDIGRNTVTRLRAAGMEVIVYDPAFTVDTRADLRFHPWPNQVDTCDFLVFTCSLTDSSRHMFNDAVLAEVRDGVRIVNVARGPLIDELALIRGLETGKIHSAALDVTEREPLPNDSPLRRFDRCIFGSHNGSNSEDAVQATSVRAIEKLFGFLDGV